MIVRSTRLFVRICVLTLIAKRDENGKPVTELSNIKVKATRTG
jgi:hypothetical protein